MNSLSWLLLVLALVSPSAFADRIEDIVPFGSQTGEPAGVTGSDHPAASEFNAAEASRSQINAFGISYEGKSSISTSDFAWAT